MKIVNPTVRFKDIVIQELPDEVLVFDAGSNRLFCLNRTISEVWKLADGSRNIRQISQAMSESFGANVDETFVLFALEELSRENLLVEAVSAAKPEKEVSRRDVLRRIGLASMIALPVITAISAPQSAHAASACPTVGTACRCVYSSLPAAGTTSCVNTNPATAQGCESGFCVCFYGAPGQACSVINATTVICGGVCQQG